MQTPISILTAYLAQQGEGGRDGGNDGRISKGSMSSIDSIGDRFVFNGCFRMARRHPNWNRHRTSRGRRCPVPAGLYCYFRFSAWSLERAKTSRGAAASSYRVGTFSRRLCARRRSPLLHSARVFSSNLHLSSSPSLIHCCLKHFRNPS